MQTTNEIPKDVVDTPAGPDGDGFVVLDILASAIVGSDGECYVRKNGVISVAPVED